MSPFGYKNKPPRFCFFHHSPLLSPFSNYTHSSSFGFTLIWVLCLVFFFLFILHNRKPNQNFPRGDQVAGEMNRPGDWNCRSCQHLNFQRRECCQRCGESKFGAEFGVFGGGGGGRGRSIPSSHAGLASPGSDVRPGDWYCGVGNCGTHNFANRSSCFVCGAFKDESAAAAGGVFDFDVSSRGSRSFGFGSNGSRGGSSWKSGDWICTRSGCNVHNFANRMECFRCNAPRDSF